MLPVLICIAIPAFIAVLFAFTRSQYGDELFGLNWPAHELNRDDDYRLIKVPFDPSVPGTGAAQADPSIAPDPVNKHL